MTKRVVPLGVISRKELLAYSVEAKGEIFRQIRKEFNRLKASCDFNQKKLAKRLSMDEGALCRRLRGENDMRIETLSDLARGLECKLDVRLIPLEQIPQLSEQRTAEVWTEAEGDTPTESIQSMSTANSPTFVASVIDARVVENAT